MPEIGKIELDDDELDKVSGGVEANEYCGDFTPKTVGAQMKCENCSFYKFGQCRK